MSVTLRDSETDTEISDESIAQVEQRMIDFWEQSDD